MTCLIISPMKANSILFLMNFTVFPDLLRKVHLMWYHQLLIIIIWIDYIKRISQFRTEKTKLLPLTTFWSRGCTRTRRPCGRWTAASCRPGWRRRSPPPPSSSGRRTRLIGGSPAIAGCTSAPPCPMFPCFRRMQPR